MLILANGVKSMSIQKFLVLSMFPILALAACAVRGDTQLDGNVVPTGCFTSECREYSCCDEDYRSECCGPNGCVLSGVCNDGCCDKVCRSTVEEVTEERSCWKIGCEEICVPRVVCPWGEGGSGLTIFNCWKKRCSSECGDCCDTCGDVCCRDNCCGCDCCMTSRCGDVRCVRVLDSEDYEVTTCKCKWDIDNCGPCCGGCCNGACGEGCGCGDSCGCASAQPAKQRPKAPRPIAAESRERISQAFGVEQVSNEEPVDSPAGDTPQPEPKKAWWSFWK